MQKKSLSSIDAAGDLLAQFESLRTTFPGPFSKLVYRVNRFTDEPSLVLPVLRQPEEEAAAVAAIATRLGALWSADPGAFFRFVEKLNRAIKNIDSRRALSLTPPTGSHKGSQKYFADLLRDSWLEPPDPIEAGRFYNLSQIGGHSDGAGWCFWFSGGTGGVYGLGDRPDDLKYWRVYKPEFTEADTREFQRQIAGALEALVANAAKRREHP